MILKAISTAFRQRQIIWRIGKNKFMEYLSANDINDGRVTRFDSQDDILAAKKGGPIDKMLDQNSAIQAQQLNVLREIRDGIRALQSSDMSFNNSSLTQEFYA